MSEIIDYDWTLFLDRDGVINKRLPGTYVKTPSEFEVLPGALYAIRDFTLRFGRIVVVTNQQGIGKKEMSHEDLESIHQYFLEMVDLTDGKVDGIYYCPDLAHEDPPCRKPNIGMGLQAQKDFPDIDFKKSIIIGDSESDIQFGKNLEMITIKIGQEFESTIADYISPSLKDVALYITN